MDDIVVINGINPNTSITTLGSTNLDLNLDELNINPKVHVINSYKISTPFDGILGDDFFQSQEAEINYKNKKK